MGANCACPACVRRESIDEISPRRTPRRPTPRCLDLSKPNISPTACEGGIGWHISADYHSLPSLLPSNTSPDAILEQHAAQALVQISDLSPPPDMSSAVSPEKQLARVIPKISKFDSLMDVSPTPSLKKHQAQHSSPPSTWRLRVDAGSSQVRKCKQQVPQAGLADAWLVNEELGVGEEDCQVLGSKLPADGMRRTKLQVEDDATPGHPQVTVNLTSALSAPVKDATYIDTCIEDSVPPDDVKVLDRADLQDFEAPQEQSEQVDLQPKKRASATDPGPAVLLRCLPSERVARNVDSADAKELLSASGKVAEITDEAEATPDMRVPAASWQYSAQTPFRLMPSVGTWLAKPGLQSSPTASAMGKGCPNEEVMTIPCPWTPHPCMFGGTMGMAGTMHGAHLCFASTSQPSLTNVGASQRSMSLSSADEFKPPPSAYEQRPLAQLPSVATWLSQPPLTNVSAQKSMSLPSTVECKQPSAYEQRPLAKLPSVATWLRPKHLAEDREQPQKLASALQCAEQIPTRDQQPLAKLPSVATWLTPKYAAEECEHKLRSFSAEESEQQHLICEQRPLAKLPSVATWLRPKYFAEECEPTGKLTSAREFAQQFCICEKRTLAKLPSVATWLRPKNDVEESGHTDQFASEEECEQQFPICEQRPLAKLPSVATWLRPKHAAEECEQTHKFVSAEECQPQFSIHEQRPLAKLPSVATWLRTKHVAEEYEHALGLVRAEECEQQVATYERRPISKMPSVATWLKPKQSAEDCRDLQKFASCEADAVENLIGKATTPISGAEEQAAVDSTSLATPQSFHTLPSAGTWVQKLVKPVEALNEKFVEPREILDAEPLDAELLTVTQAKDLGAPGTGTLVRVGSRSGKIIIEDESDLPFKVAFNDGQEPAADWFSRGAVVMLDSTSAAPAEAVTPSITAAAFMTPLFRASQKPSHEGSRIQYPFPFSAKA